MDAKNGHVHLEVSSFTTTLCASNMNGIRLCCGLYLTFWYVLLLQKFICNHIISALLFLRGANILTAADYI